MNNSEKYWGNLAGNNKGFTLVEAMVAMLVTGIVLAAIITFYVTQTRIMTSQRIVAEMIRNARTAVYFLENEFRMAGYSYNRNEAWAETVDELKTGLETTEPQKVVLTYIADGDGYDNDADGVVDEQDEVATVEYELVGNDLVRIVNTSTGAVRQVIASNIENFELDYVPDSENGTIVRISILVRTSKKMPFLSQNQFGAARTFTTLSGNTWDVPDSQGFARRLFTTVVQCRNTGL